ncbi:vesicle-associated membrane protein [Artemisia annua]|uniref:Vesicle-associated membrane protein n=2 Tax=Artemisia annua TaxID=35608 RepID=A0A2U1NY08_ARTAN|nr:vesicle-associated membrane protein [Artemisia annua]
MRKHKKSSRNVVDDESVDKTIGSSGEELNTNATNHVISAEPVPHVSGFSHDSGVESSLKSKQEFIETLFGVSLKTLEDIDAFTQGLEAGNYTVWDELENSVHKRAKDVVLCLWEAFKVEHKAKSNTSKPASESPIVQSVDINANATSYAGATEMSQKGLIYSFVAKGTIVLAEHTAYSGNVSTVAVQCLQKLPSGSTKYTYACDGYTFNFLLDTGFVFLVVADESAGRSMPFVFLERVKDDFKKRYGASIGSDHPLADDSDDDLFEDRFSIAYNLDREFGPKIKEHMDYCLNHPDEMSKLSKLKAQITEVKGIMMDNIEKVLDRGEKIELLVDKTENLQFQADSFQRQGRSLRRKMWLQNLQMKLMVGGAIAIFIIIVWLMACRGFKC